MFIRKNARLRNPAIKLIRNFATCEKLQDSRYKENPIQLYVYTMPDGTAYTEAIQEIVDVWWSENPTYLLALKNSYAWVRDSLWDPDEISAYW